MNKKSQARKAVEGYRRTMKNLEDGEKKLGIEPEKQ
jgi:hypothetical protein